MSGLQKLLAVIATALAILSVLVPFGTSPDRVFGALDMPGVLGFALLALASLVRFRVRVSPFADLGIAVFGAFVVIRSLDPVETAGPGFWLVLVSAWAFAWLFAERLAGRLSRTARLGVLIPLVFGLSILVAWEAITRGGNVPKVLLPSPSGIWQTLIANVPKLWADFEQTFMKAVLTGYLMGCGAGFVVAVAVDRSPFLKRGLLPLGSFVSALPLIGIAPIMVMWFGFDWPSKAAVVVIMTFFPMLVNTVAGLNVAGRMERDLMRTYAAGYWQSLVKLRLPAAAPFIFNALKINSTLALIGAIVAEFFGTPIVGMGFRISSEIGKLNVEMVWAEIAVAALAGSAFYWVVAIVERAITFWHPSVRGGRT